MRGLLIISILFFHFGSIIAATHGDERSIFLDERMRETKKKNATYYCELVGVTDEMYHYKAYFLSGELKMEGWYTDEEMKKPVGLFTFYYQSGQVESKGEYREGEKYGIWQRYDRYGNEKSEKIYAFLPMLKELEKAKKE
jgi:antitoxin component YwqK of YwqJK toxin-antitoxin module